jgi:hypothetical protein
MIGWTSRNSRDQARRDRWWASLTDDQKALERRRSKVEDRWALYGFAVIFSYLLLVGSQATRDWAHHHIGVFFALMLLGHPGGMIVLAFVIIYKRRQVT